MEDGKFIKFLGRIKSSSVEEDEKKKDAFVTTTVKGQALPGLFAKYSSDLENIAFNLGGWAGINTQEQASRWVMVIFDAQSRETIATFKNCTIKNINLTRVFKKNGEEISTSFKIGHAQTEEQGALEAAVSTEILMELVPDTELFNGQFDGKKPEESDDSTEPSGGSV